MKRLGSEVHVSIRSLGANAGEAGRAADQIAGYQEGDQSGATGRANFTDRQEGIEVSATADGDEHLDTGQVAKLLNLGFGAR